MDKNVVPSELSPEEVTSDFMHELFKRDRDLMRDKAFARRCFSSKLRKTMKVGRRESRTYEPPKDTIWKGHPTVEDEFNRTLFNAWDTPTSYVVGESKIAEDGAIVTVIYHWGKGCQYAGDQRETLVKLVHEHGAWRIDDLLTQEGRYVPASSLQDSLILEDSHGLD